MKKIGNIWVSLFRSGDTHYEIEFIGGPTSYYVWLSFGKRGIAIDIPLKPSSSQKRQYITPHMPWPKKYYKLTLFGRTFIVGGCSYFKSSNYSIGIYYSSYLEDHSLSVNLGLYRVNIEWQSPLNEKRLRKERQARIMELDQYFKNEGIIEGTAEYNEQMTKALNEHDKFMAKTPDERYEEMARWYEKHGGL